MAEIQMMHVAQLRIHPQNIRQYYPAESVAEMAESIRAASGVIQALLVTPAGQGNGHGPEYFVVDGNMRLAAARTLGDLCPLLKCEVVDADRTQQLLMMAITSEFHYPKDPISEARHYRRLMQQEGMKVEQIAGLIGISPSKVYNRIFLLTMDDDVQELVMRRKISVGEGNHLRQLMKIPDKMLRVSLAKRFAAKGSSVVVMRKAIDRAIEQYSQMTGEPVPSPRRKPGAAAKVEVIPGGGINAAEINRLAEMTLCDGCRLDGLTKKCWVCPGPYDFINALLEKVEVNND